MRIAAGDWELTTAPELGGAILSLARDGIAILRDTPDGSEDILSTACFPLVPYANRIAFGTFAWEGTTRHLPHNYPGQDHPLHGVGWLSRWDVESHDANGVVMRFTHAADQSWPWGFTARQRLTLSSAGLEAELELVNDDSSAMPVSLGFHPYFSASGVTSLRFEANDVWLVDRELIPCEHAPADTLGDWSVGGTVSRPDLVDNCYTGWSGSAVIDRAEGAVLLHAESAPAVHVYIPPGNDFFCVEPVTAMPDAVNRGEAATLAPGESQRVGMRITSA